MQISKLAVLAITVCSLQGAACQPDKAAPQNDLAQKAQATLVADAPKPNGVVVGDAAPEFELKGVDGQMYSFDNIKDANGETPKGFIVVFTCNTCPYAVMYEDRIIALHNTYSPQGYPVVAIQPNDTEIKPGDNMEAMQQRVKDKNIPYHYLLDEGQKIYPQYGAARTPEVYLVDDKGIVRYHGAIDDNAEDASAATVNYVGNAVKALQEGRSPDPADVKAIGCSIKAKKS